MKRLMLVAVALMLLTASASAQTEIQARAIATESGRIANLGRTIFNSWNSDRYDAIEALLLQRACANHRYGLTWTNNQPEQRELWMEARRQADRAISDMHQTLLRHAFDELRNESVSNSAMIANIAESAFSAYQLGYEAAIQRTWYSDAATFERDCASR